MKEEREKHKGRPAMLDNEVWGAAITEPSSEVKEGDIVSITAKSGKTWSTEILKVVAELKWGMNNVVVVATSKEGAEATGLSDGKLPEATERENVKVTDSKFRCPHCNTVLLAHVSDDLPF